MIRSSNKKFCRNCFVLGHWLHNIATTIEGQESILFLVLERRDFALESVVLFRYVVQFGAPYCFMEPFLNIEDVDSSLNTKVSLYLQTELSLYREVVRCIWAGLVQQWNKVLFSFTQFVLCSWNTSLRAGVVKSSAVAVWENSSHWMLERFAWYLKCQPVCKF